MAKTKRGIASEFGKAYKALRQCYPDKEVDHYGFNVFVARRFNGESFFIFRFRWDEHYTTSWCDYYISKDGLETIDYMGTFCVGAGRVYAASVYERMGLDTETDWADVAHIYDDEYDLKETLEDLIYAYNEKEYDGWTIKSTCLGKRDQWYVHRFLVD